MIYLLRCGSVMNGNLKVFITQTYSGTLLMTTPKSLKKSSSSSLTVEEQQFIYEHYGVELFTPMLSPVRPQETRPSFSTYLSEDGGQIRWKDFAYKSGGVFDFIIEMEERVNTFRQAVDKAREILSGFVVKNSVVEASRPLLVKPKVDWEVIPADKFSKAELLYWKIRGINESQLRKENIFPLKMLLADGKYRDTSTPDNPKFIYYYYDDSGNITGWKLYSPYDPDHKWLSKNTSSSPYESKVQCVHNELFILSSKKDKMVFDNLQLPYDTTNPIAEGIFKGILRELSGSLRCYTNIYAWLDFDWCENLPNVYKGVERTQQLEIESGGRIKGLYLPPDEAAFLLPRNIKDIDEVFVNLGAEYLKNLFIKTQNYSLQ